MAVVKPSGDALTVRVLKYDGAQYRTWRACIAHCQDSLLVLNAAFDVDISHKLLGDIRRGTRTVEYYWLDRWYNVFRFLNDAGETRLYYCNINMPPRLENNSLTYVDLDIDVLVQPDFSYEILDLDEFEANARRYNYADHVKKAAQAALDDLISLIETNQFPFQNRQCESGISDA